MAGGQSCICAYSLSLSLTHVTDRAPSPVRSAKGTDWFYHRLGAVPAGTQVPHSCETLRLEGPRRRGGGDAGPGARLQTQTVTRREVGGRRDRSDSVAGRLTSDPLTCAWQVMVMLHLEAGWTGASELTYFGGTAVPGGRLFMSERDTRFSPRKGPPPHLPPPGSPTPLPRRLGEPTSSR